METQKEEGNIKKSSNGMNNTMIRVLIVVIIVLVLALVYIFAFQDREEKNQDNSNLTTANQNSNAQVNDNRSDFKTTNSQEGQEVDVSGESQIEEAEKSPEAVSRDEQRVADIKKIQDALAKFKNEKGNYPEKIEDLVPTYLSEIPKNPAPGGIDYVYTPIGKLPAEYYDLAYELEAGTAEVKDAGTHIASPDLIANP